MSGYDDVIQERRRLVALAFRMLGTMAEAEDAVQETYLRWYRLTEEQRATVTSVPAWLTRVASNVCLDVLKSARVRREQYVGPWLPEPLPLAHLAADDPADRVTLDDTVSTALLIVLETMTAAERVAFVLHDVFALPFPEIATIVGRSPSAVRQLASSARRRVEASRAMLAPVAEHAAVVSAFAAACQGGDLNALLAVLDPSVELRSDGGGVVKASPNPIHGADKAGRFLLGILRRRPEWTLGRAETADGLALVLLHGDAVEGVVNAGVVGGRIRDLWLVLNPEKLTRWG